MRWRWHNQRRYGLTEKRFSVNPTSAAGPTTRSRSTVRALRWAALSLYSHAVPLLDVDVSNVLDQSRALEDQWPRRDSDKPEGIVIFPRTESICRIK